MKYEKLNDSDLVRIYFYYHIVKCVSFNLLLLHMIHSLRMIRFQQIM